MRFKVSSPHVVFDVIEEEVVVVNLRLGHYYSLRGAGVDIWEAFAAGLTEDEVSGVLAERCDAEPGEIEKSVRALLENFKKEGLLTAMAERELKDFQPSFPGTRQRKQAGRREKFCPPDFQKFTDMEDVLLLDPVHDVDERGWPNRPGASVS